MNIILCLGLTTTWRTVLKGHSFRKVESHCSNGTQRSKSVVRNSNGTKAGEAPWAQAHSHPQKVPESPDFFFFQMPCFWLGTTCIQISYLLVWIESAPPSPYVSACSSPVFCTPEKQWNLEEVVRLLETRVWKGCNVGTLLLPLLFYPTLHSLRWGSTVSWTVGVVTVFMKLWGKVHPFLQYVD